MRLPRIALYSDLHLNDPAQRAAVEGALLPGAAELIVLAGDIAHGTAGVAWAAATFPDHPVAYVLGNHDYYGSSIEGTIAACREAARGTTVRVLERDAWDVAGVRVLGCTFWTDFALDDTGRGEQLRDMKYANRTFNDMEQIRTQDGEPFVAAIAARHHATARAWLEQALRQAAADGVPAVVVTHHAPTALAITRARRDRYGPTGVGFFASRCEAWMDEPWAPALWCFGHTHENVAERIYRTGVCSNQLGMLSKGEGAGFLPSGAVPLAVTQ